MSIAVNKILPIVAAQGVSGNVAFQPGSVIAARVLNVMPDNQVRISIGGQAIDVQSEVPLQAGQTLQLAVSQTSDGVRLAVVTPQATPTSANTASSSTNSGLSLEAATLVPDALLSSATTATASLAQLSATEALAVSTAAQNAATQQAGLSPLFANLGSVASMQGLPPPLQQAIAQVLAQQPSLDANLTGDDIKAAFENSGLFLESNLAAGSPATSSAMPDMKAALIVLRQVLSTSLGDAPPLSRAPTVAVEQSAQAPVRVVASSQGPAVTFAQIAAATPAAPSLVPDADVAESSLQQNGPGVSDEFPGQHGPVGAFPPSASSSLPGNLGAAGTASALNMLQEALQSDAQTAVQPLINDQMLHDLLPGAQPQTTRAGMVSPDTPPPPPLRGALPFAQAVAISSLASETSLAGIVKHLLGNTDAALARQTLMQIASLPDSADGSPTRVDPAAARWNFEIPFATPQGTAVAQFEISKDGGNDSEASAAQRVWRARFSLNVEPAGPVHAQVSLVGEKTSVRMWAERPATASQLRAGMSQLAQALTLAELTPGDIVIREGAPAQAAPASAGHFLDRAL